MKPIPLNPELASMRTSLQVQIRVQSPYSQSKLQQSNSIQTKPKPQHGAFSVYCFNNNHNMNLNNSNNINNINNSIPLQVAQVNTIVEVNFGNLNNNNSKKESNVVCSVAAILDDVLTQLWFASARTGVVGMLLWLPTSLVIVGKEGVHQIGEIWRCSYI